jgi:PAS domain S-box-containing protein
MSAPAFAPALRLIPELHRLLVEAVEGYAIYMIDLDGTVLSWNVGAERSKGYRSEEIVGRNYSVFFPADAIKRREPQLQLERARKEGRLQSEGWRVRKDGSRFWASVAITAVHDESGALVGFAKVTRDLTEQRNQEIVLTKAMEEAASANRAKSNFLANMSHELRTPLNAVIGFSQLLISGVGGALTNKNREYAGHIEQSGQHLLSLINDLLDISKLDAGELKLDLQEFDLHPLSREAVASMEPQAARAGVHLLLEVRRPLAIRADRRRLMQVFLNLLSNAIKFTPEGGRVTIAAWDTDEGAHIEVEDNGIGMDPDEIPVAMARFGQVESHLRLNKQGTGLGLPLVQQLVELHGGRLDLTSCKGTGTRIHIVLPQIRRTP